MTRVDKALSTAWRLADDRSDVEHAWFVNHGHGFNRGALLAGVPGVGLLSLLFMRGGDEQWLLVHRRSGRLEMWSRAKGRAGWVMVHSAALSDRPISEIRDQGIEPKIVAFGEEWHVRLIHIDDIRRLSRQR